MQADEVATIIPTKPEAEVAGEIKKEVTAKLIELCAVMDRANKAGFVVTWAISPIPPGKNVVTQVVVSKNY